MPYFRFARNCVQSNSVIPTKCPCCDAIKLLVVDGQDRIRAVGNMSVEELREVVARFDAGQLPLFPMPEEGAGRPH